MRAEGHSSFYGRIYLCMSVYNCNSLCILELQVSVLFSWPGTSEFSPSVNINALVNEKGSR